MSVSKVYFTDMRCKVGTSLLEKLDKLMIAAGIGEIDFENKFVAIKLHFGDPGIFPSCGRTSPRRWPTG